MTVRAARFTDIPAIVGIMDRAHRRSEYADLTFDKEAAKQLLVRSIQRHGHMNYNGTLVLVSESQRTVRGFVIGVIDHVYPCLMEYRVTDLFFIFDEGADARDPRRMVRSLRVWAEDNPKVHELVLGATGAINEWERTGKLYEHAGMQRYGGMWRLVIDRSQQEVAACLG